MGAMDCVLCEALCASRQQVVLPTAAPVGGLLAIGEAPGAVEDSVGYGFAGQAGKTLDGLLAAHGIERAGYGRANVCRCRPPGNRKPTRREVNACLPWLAEFILAHRPRVLLLVGGTAAAYFLGRGSLFDAIQASRTGSGKSLDFSQCHPALDVLAKLPLALVPMPHTSGMAWHRKAPNGQAWCDIGREQVRLAVERLRLGSVL